MSNDSRDNTRSESGSVEDVEEEAIIASKADAKSEEEGEKSSRGPRDNAASTTVDDDAIACLLMAAAEVDGDTEEEPHTNQPTVTEVIEKSDRTAEPAKFDADKQTNPEETNIPTTDVVTPSDPAPCPADIPSAQGRVVSNAVPAMNSMNHIVQDMNKMDLVTNPETAQYRRHANPPQSSIYQRNRPARLTTAPSWYTPMEKPVRNVVATPQRNNQNQNPNYSAVQVARTASPIRKTSATSPPYVGSQVIAAETGPSLTVLLRRPTSERPWGFTFYGGSEYGCPPFVNKVVKNSVAFQHGVQVGDVIVSICQTLTVGKTLEQLKAEILRAGNELDLILIRRGVDLDKLAMIAPQALQSPVRSPAASLAGSSFDFGFVDDSTPLSRGRSFRAVKTKSLKLLEQQLNTGQATTSTMIKRQQHYQTRSVPATRSTSTFTDAYGQNRSRGYIVQVSPTRSYTEPRHPMSPLTIHPSYTNYQYAQSPPYQGNNWERMDNVSYPGWGTRPDYGMQYNSQFTNYSQPIYGVQPAQYPQQYPAQQGYHPHMVSTSVTVPLSGPPAIPQQFPPWPPR